MDKPTLVFPRTCVKITQQGSPTVVADPNTVVLYRGEQEYSRVAVDGNGDNCEWFEVDPNWLRFAAEPYDPDLSGPDAPPVRHTHAPANAEAYSLQRSLTRMISGSSPVDTMVVEESLLRLVDLVIPGAYMSRNAVTGYRTRAETEASHRDLVDDTKAYLATNFNQPISLSDIGAAVGSSRFHLARLFRHLTGNTLHRHLTGLRLRAALALLDDTDRGISEIAIGVGFSSHSHFTQAFRRAFAVTPKVYRQHPDQVLRTLIR